MTMASLQTAHPPLAKAPPRAAIPDVAPALDGGAWQERVAVLRPNASTLTHAELDAMEELDEGDLGLLTTSVDRLRDRLPALAVVGGCCGTDARHVGALWGV